MSVETDQEAWPRGVATGTVMAVSRSGEYSFSKPAEDEIVLVPGLGVDGDVHAGPTVRHRSRVAADPKQPNLRQVHLIHGELFDEVREQGFAVAPGQLGENITTRGVDLLSLPSGTVLRFGPPPPDGEGAPAGGHSVGGPSEVNGSVGEVVGADAASRDAGAGGSVRDAVAGVVAAAEDATLDRSTAEAAAALVAAVERESGRTDHRPAVVVTGLRNPCRQIDRFRDGLLERVAYRDEDGILVRKAGVMSVVVRGGAVRPGDPITVEMPPPPHRPLDRV
jgi:hypothetical protein